MNSRPGIPAAGAVLAALTLVVAGGRAQAGSDPKLAFERYRLDNGLEVILHQDRSVPLVAVDVWYHVGSGDETPGKSGFAHLFEHMMFQGTKHTGEDAHFNVLRKIGASSVNGSTNSDRTNYFEVVPSHQIETALWLESERMGYLLDMLNDTSLANQRDVVRNERRQNYDNVPYGAERFAINAALYPEGHPYRYLTIGRHEDLAAASVDDVKGFFRKWYVPANATLTLAGDFDRDAARKLVDKWFGTFPRTERPAHHEVAPPPITATHRDTLTDNFAKLRRVHWVWNSPKAFAPGDAELGIVADALGRQGTGRLYKILVHDKELAQNVACYQSGAGFSGQFHVVVDLKKGADMREVERILDEEFARVRREPVTKREFERVIVENESRLVWGLEPILPRAEALQRYNHFVDAPDYITQDLDRYRKTTVERVRDVTAEYLQEQNRVEVVTLPVTAARDSQQAVARPGAAAASLARSILDQVVPVTPGPAVAVFPEEAFRAQQPPAGKLPPFHVPKIERFKLANGIEVYLVERHQLPTVAMQLVFEGGASEDPPGKEGLASSAMTLLGDGTEKLDKIAFREALADLASTVSTGAGVDQLTVGLSTLARNLDTTLDLWADALLRAGMRQDEFDRDVKQRLNGLAQQKGSPAGVAGRLDNSIVFGPEHAYGRFATETSIRALTREECKQFVADYLAPAGARLYVVGDITRSQIEAKVGGRLAGWQGKPKPSATVGAPQPRAGSIFVVDIPKAPQSVLRLMHLGPKRQAADYFPNSILSGILGGGFASRINMNIREKHGWAYGARGGFTYLRDAGAFVASASVKSDKTKESIQEMRKEIEGIRAAEVTDEEMAREKDGSILALPAQFATGEQILGTYSTLIYFGLPLDYYESAISKVQAVTKQQVLAAAREHLRPDELQLLVVGDAQTILPGIRELIAAKELQGDVTLLDADGKPVAAEAGAAPAPAR